MPITRKITPSKSDRGLGSRRVSFSDLEKGKATELVAQDTTDAFHDAVENLPPVTEHSGEEEEEEEETRMMGTSSPFPRK